MSDQFYETIFLKDDSTQDYELSLYKNNPYSNEEEQYMLEMGIAGEKQIMYHLKKSNIGMYALRDINLQHNDFKAQIDFVLVTSHHCYFVECKNYKADIIHVDEIGNFSLSTRYKRKYNRMGIPSPVSQVENQLNVFKKVCLNDQEMTKALLNGNKFKDYFKTLVVFTDKDAILDLKKAPYDLKYRILKVDNLIRQIEYDNNHFNGTRLSKEEMKNIADYFLINNCNEKFEKLQHTQKQQIINVDNNKASDSKNISKQQEKIKKKTTSILIEIGLGLFWIIGVSVVLLLWSKWMINKNNKEQETKQKYNQQETYSQSSRKKLTNNQQKAISILKTGYDNSKKDGFDIIHKSVCDEISGIFDNELNCAGGKYKVNIDNNIIMINHTFTCYTFSISDNNECNGQRIGVIEWDTNNEYYNKIGGYNKIRELSIYSYKNNNIYDYFDYRHVEERGGVKGLSTTYKLVVDNFFGGVTGRLSYDTTREKFDEMVKYYYYIMK